MRVLAFGDSIAQGFIDIEAGGWVQRLVLENMAEAMNELDSDWTTVFNLGVSGHTAAELVKRITPEITARRWMNDPLAVIIGVGINDALIENTRPWSSPEQYCRQLANIIQQVRLETGRILFIGLTSVDETLTTPVSWGDYSYTNQRIWQFENALRELVEKENLPHVPVFEVFRTRLAKGEDLLADGLHPNAAGHELIARLVRPKLAKLIEV